MWPTLLYLFIPQNVPITCLWLWQTICQPPDTSPIINICSYKLPFLYSHLLVREAFELPNVDFLRNFSVQGLIIRSTGRMDNPPKCPKWNGLSVPPVERIIRSILTVSTSVICLLEQIIRSIGGTDNPFHFGHYCLSSCRQHGGSTRRPSPITEEVSRRSRRQFIPRIQANSGS